jgi:GNAT superfamily N-acetyltransferase
MTACLRTATRADIAAIFRVRYAVRENTLRHGVIGDEDVRREIEDSGRGWVIEVAPEAGSDPKTDNPPGQIVAFAIGNKLNGNIWALFVHPDAEGCGHGRRLHDTMVGWLWAQGLQKLWLNTGAGTRAQTFYERNGWLSTGRTERGELRFELLRPAETHSTRETP